MNIKEAIKILEERGWLRDIQKIGKNKYKARNSHNTQPDWQYEEFTARELINQARCYTSDDRQKTTLKSLIKKMDKRKNRASTRDLIKTEEFDKIPQNGKTKGEDIWNWD